MPGKLYKNDVLLAKAYSEGQDAGVAGALITTNPHTVGTPEADAWDEGWTNGDTLDCAPYAGGAACSIQDESEPTPPVVVTLNAYTATMAVAAGTTVTATVTQGGVAQAGKSVAGAKSNTKFNFSPSAGTTNASGQATFTLTGVGQGVGEFTASYGGVTTLPCVVTVT
jgi:hypothetical protein